MKTRGDFIKSASLAAAGAGLSTFVPLETLAARKKLFSANEKINVAAIGINGMGWADFSSLLKLPEVNPVAICDVDDNVLNFRKYELAKNGIKVATYADYRK